MVYPHKYNAAVKDEDLYELICSDFQGVFFFFYGYLFIYFWEKKRKKAKEVQRERRQRIPSSLRAISTEPSVGLELMNCEIMTEPKSGVGMLNQLSHPGAP